MLPVSPLVLLLPLLPLPISLLPVSPLVLLLPLLPLPLPISLLPVSPLVLLPVSLLWLVKSSAHTLVLSTADDNITPSNITQTKTIAGMELLLTINANL
jgi:hypothetical protein